VSLAAIARTVAPSTAGSTSPRSMVTSSSRTSEPLKASTWSSADIASRMLPPLEKTTSSRAALLI